jgi:hypothetical protein
MIYLIAALFIAGSLLGIAIGIAVIYLAWQAVRKAYFWK